MAIIYIHAGGGCEYIIREDGNEIVDWEIHRYLCPMAATKHLIFSAGFEKNMCDNHANEFERKLIKKKNKI